MVRIGKLIRALGHCIKKDPILTLLILLAFALYMVVAMPSGSRYCMDSGCGVYFWGAHEHDGVWHLALIESAFRSIPFTSPIFLGAPLTGYNYLLDLIIAIPGAIGVAPSILYFKFQPLAWFVMFSTLLYCTGRLIEQNRGFIRWLFFIVFFSASLGIVIQIVKHQTLSGTVGNPTMQGALSMTNPQYMWSLGVLLAIWLLLQNGRRVWLAGPLIFAGLGLKFYFILPALLSVLWYVVVYVLNGRRRLILPLLSSTFIGISTAFLLFYSGSSRGGLVLNPLAIPHQIIEDKDLWYDQVMVQERYFITQLGHYFSPRLWWIEARTIALFVLFNFGIRIVGVVGSILLVLRNRKGGGMISMMLLIIVACIMMPILFTQQGTWWNTIQFLYYAIFVSSILTAYVLWRVISKLHVVARVIVLLICIGLFLPPNLEMVQVFTSSKSVNFIPDAEIEALSRMRTLPRGIILTQVFQRESSHELPESYDTAYVSAYTGKPTYLADEAQLALLGHPYERIREHLIKEPCMPLDTVRYVYVRKGTAGQTLAQCIRKSQGWTLWYQNSASEVWIKELQH